MTEIAAAPPQAWADAVLAASILAIDPVGLGGIRVRGRAGPVRDSWMDHLAACFAPDVPIRRIAAGIADSRLSGGLDVGLTLERGAPVVERGVLAAAHGGVVVLAMAERLCASSAGIVAAAMDSGHAQIERDGLSLRHAARFSLVALDEGIDDECPPPALIDRLGLTIDIDAIALRDAIGPGRRNAHRTPAALSAVTLPDELAAALIAASLATGARSMRASLFLCRTARALAAHRGVATVAVEDVVTALRLVLGVQIGLPDQVEEPSPDPPDPADDASEPPSGQSPEDDALSRDMTADMIVEAIKASLPKDLLEYAAPGRPRGRQAGSGRSGEPRRSAVRGRAVGVSDRPPSPGARLDVLSTLRQAAPWQRIRRDAAAVGPAKSRLLVRKQDFRYIRHREKAGTTAIFAVDASGSAAYERLAETKGAVELLLADCYVRRDSVAMIAFRGAGADVLLEPTRSLVRARRCLSALPGGGGTPLAAGVLATLAMADGAARKGQHVVAIFLTDGRGNVGLDGVTGRDQVAEEISRAATRFRGAGIRAILIDTARRPQARAAALASELGAEYLALPFGNASTIAREIGERMEG
jgi:magnesium chelatase subunit D